MLRAKREAVERMLGSQPAHVAYLAVDFERDDLVERLREAGLGSEPCFFIWEGVTSYLSAAGVDATLRCIGTSAAPGSGIAFTYLNRRALEGSRPGLASWAASVDRAGEPFSFGLDPDELPGYLAERGLEPLKDVSTAQAAPAYLRPFGRNGEGSTAAHVVRARVPAAGGNQ